MWQVVQIGACVRALRFHPGAQLRTLFVFHPAIRINDLLAEVFLRYRMDGSLRRRFFPFGAFRGRVQVQRLDVNGDGLLDVVAHATINGKKRTRTFLT